MKNKTNLTTREAAHALGIGLRHVLTLLYEGKLSGAKKAGRKWAIPMDAVESRLKAREQSS